MAGNFAIAQNVTSTTVTLSWTSPGDDGNSGTASVYDIRYSLSEITASNWDNATQVTGEPSPQVAGSSESFTVEDLQPGTTYYFAVMTADEVPNWSELSNVISRTTLDEDVAPSAIAGLSVDNITGSSVRLNWIAPGDDGSTGTADAYDIRYSTSPITESNWDNATQATGEPAPLVAGTSQSFVVSGLSMETTYYFAIKTADEVPNWSGLSNVVNATTIDDVPPAAINDLAGVFELIIRSGLA